MIDADTYWLLDFDVRIHFVFLAGTYFLLRNFFPKLKVSSLCIYIYISIMSLYVYFSPCHNTESYLPIICE